MNTIKNISTIETISTQQATAVKGGLTDTRTKSGISSLTGWVSTRP